MTDDVEQLRLLSIFHFVVGGIAALCSLFPTMHLFMGIAMVAGRFGDGDQAEARLFGWLFIVLASVMIAAGLAFAASLIFAGRCLARRTHYTFCFVVAALECVFVPIGTILGVFTIVVLQRPTVKKVFSDASRQYQGVD